MKGRKGREQKKVWNSNSCTHAESSGEESRLGEPFPVDLVEIVVAIVAFPGQRSIASDLGKERGRFGKDGGLERHRGVGGEGQGPANTK